MRALYTLLIHGYGLAIRLAAVFNSKARLWVQGRRNWESLLQAKLTAGSGPIIWMHCASLGEFEQGRPILEALRQQHPGYRLLLSFFSPSGYEVRKNYAGADIICYLPLDTPRNARKFCALVQPTAVVFIKYEFWLNHLQELTQRQIPHVLVAAIFRPDQAFFKSWGGLFRKALRGYSHVFVQEAQSLQLLTQVGLTTVSRAGDPRFDRVSAIAAQAAVLPIAEAFAGAERRVLVAGSAWPADEALLFPALASYLQHDWKLLIAPHELGESHLSSIEQLLVANGLNASRAVVRYSQATPESAAAARVLIIDNIGMLSALYRYGQLAYIGGGFGRSIHNTLEAAVYGIPVIFGPKHQKFNEALGLLACGGGLAVDSAAALKAALDRLLTQPQELALAGALAGAYVRENLGATDEVMNWLGQALKRHSAG